MIEVFKTLAVIALAVSGIAAGYYISRIKRIWWTLGFFIPLIFVVMIGLARRFEALFFIAPFSWFMACRMEFVLMGPAIGMMLTTPLMRLDSRRKKILVATLMGIVLVFFPVPPFAIPLFMRGYYSRMETSINEDGVCLQSTMYNCGPASAVTALKMHGVDAGEGELAILAFTTPITGTPPDLLCNAMNGRFGNQGIKCSYRYFDSMEDLRKTEGVIIAVMKLTYFIDHYVTVMEVTDEHIVVGDPLRGKEKYEHETFERSWRRSGIVVTRAARR